MNKAKKQLCVDLAKLFDDTRKAWREVSKEVKAFETEGNNLKMVKHKFTFFTFDLYYQFLEHLNSKAETEIIKNEHTPQLEIVGSDDAENIIDLDNRFQERKTWYDSLVKGVWDVDPDLDEKAGTNLFKTEDQKESELNGVIDTIAAAIFKADLGLTIVENEPDEDDLKRKAAEEAE